MFSPRLQQSGFNLLELMLTLAIIAIVAVFAIPSMRGILSGSELSTTSNQLVFGLQSARSEAIKRITPVSLCPSADPEAALPACGGTYTQGWIVFIDENGDGVLDAPGDELIRSSEALSRAFSITPDMLFSDGVTFSISGVSINVAGVPISGRISVSHAGEQEGRVISIAASGRISSSALANINTEEDDG
ncbi:MAG: GspH/FimT family pseudopilin [Granulosicoccus sp.]